MTLWNQHPWLSAWFKFTEVIKLYSSWKMRSNSLLGRPTSCNAGIWKSKEKSIVFYARKATKKVWFIFAGLLCAASIANPDSCPPHLPGIALWLNTWIFHGKPKPFQLLHVIQIGNCRLPKKTHFHTTHLSLSCKYLAQKSTPVVHLPVQVWMGFHVLWAGIVLSSSCWNTGNLLCILWQFGSDPA